MTALACCWSSLPPSHTRLTPPSPISYLSPINSAGLRAVLQYLDAAGYLGLKVHVDITYWTEAIARGDAPIFGGNWTSQLADIKTIVEYFKDHPGVLGWYISGNPAAHV